MLEVKQDWKPLPVFPFCKDSVAKPPQSEASSSNGPWRQTIESLAKTQSRIDGGVHSVAKLTQPVAATKIQAAARGWLFRTSCAYDTISMWLMFARSQHDDSCIAIENYSETG